jgi:tungstate transport system ATP-binding protein
MRVELKNLNKKYAKKQILNLDAYTFESGKIYGIIGPNGAGKTTLLRMISGLDKSYEGSIVYNYDSLHEEIQKYVTLLSQHPYMMNRTVFDNIIYPLKVRKSTKESSTILMQKKVVDIMSLLKIESLASQNALQLSTGETQKVALARALVFEPKLLLLDEPTANIDPESMLVIEDVLKRYNKEHLCTIIAVTHNIEQASRFCTDVVKMSDGGLC